MNNSNEEGEVVKEEHSISDDIVMNFCRVTYVVVSVSKDEC